MAVTSNAVRSYDSLRACVKAHALSCPDAPALLAPGRPVCSYAGLAAHLDRLETALNECLPAANPVIAVAAGNGPDVVTAVVSAMSAGVCAPFDPSRPPAEIDAFLADVMPSLVLADDAAIARHREAFAHRGLGVVRMVPSPTLAAGVFEVCVDVAYRGRPRIPACDSDTALLIRTSGTTAVSKLVPHTMPRVVYVATSVAAAMELLSADRCLNTMALHHIYPITSVVGASLVAGASLVCPANIGGAALVDALRAYDPTWYTAAPPTHRDLLTQLRREAQPPKAPSRSLRFGRTNGAPIDAQLVADLESVLGAPIFNGYGTTEAPSAAFNVPSSNRSGSAGRAVHCEIAILDGEVAIRGANIAPAYADSSRTPITDTATGWYHTGDAGYLDGDGYLFITGRLNDLINVGGEKVAPGQVEAVLKAHPAVADAVVFPLPHPTLGQHVAAVVVSRPGATVTQRDLIEHAALLLPRAAVPNVVHHVDAIPREDNGKVRRRELTETFARASRIVPLDPNQAEEDALVQSLARIWQDVLESGPVPLDENFFAAGGDSLRALAVMTRIEAELGITISDDALLFAPTIRELAHAVRTAANATRRDRIVPLRSTGSRPPLFFYDNDVDGGGLYARFLPSALDPEQPVYVVRPHGAHGDDIPESIEAMGIADAVMIAAAVPSATYRLAGFCAGGVVALEVARRLASAGANVDVVALIGSSAPNASLKPLWAFTSRATAFLSPRGATRVYKALRSIVNAARARSYPAEIVNAFYGAGHPLAPLTVAGQAYSELLVRHFPERTSLTIDLIWPNDDLQFVAGDPSMGWRYVANVRRHTVSGDHATVLTDHIGELGAALRRIVDSADAR